jgi:hypothetical protein
MTTIVKIKEHSKQLHECLKDKTCGIIDRGLAQCHITGRFCSYLSCPKLEGNVTQTANNQTRIGKLNYAANESSYEERKECIE